LRRLLIFGTGAAVIGTLLLITAFYETYLIVNGLQSHLNTAIANTSNNLLEASTLEAVFLGIMAALGYVLIAQGLEGIRKQELVDMQRGAASLSTAELRTRAPSAEGQGEKPRAWPSILTAKGGVAQMSDAPAEQNPPPSAAEPQKTFLFSSQTQASSSTGTAAEQPASPSGSGPAEQRMRAPEPAVTMEASPVEVSSLEKTTGAASASTASKGSDDNAVSWEGGAPAPLRGVDVIPEPPTYRSWPATSLRAAQITPPVAETSEPGLVPVSEIEAGQGEPPRKRGRGRPKGTKKKKTQQSETTEEDKKPEQSESPEQGENPQQSV